MPKRSRSVGDRLATPAGVSDYQKSLENIPVEIREQFNPAFAQELNKLVRQKSKRREEEGFVEPTSREHIDEDDFSGKLNTLSRKPERRGSVSNTLSRTAKSQEYLTQEYLPEKNKSAYETLFKNSQTINRAVPGKPPRSKSTSNYLDIKANEDKLVSDTSFAGTNNSSLRFPSETSQESIYDNVHLKHNPPSKRTDQPPPKLMRENSSTQSLSKDLKTATMILRNRYQNDLNGSRTLPKSRQSTNDHIVGRKDQYYPQNGTKLNQTLPMKPIKTSENDSGRLFMMSGKEPLLHCRNTACTNSGKTPFLSNSISLCDSNVGVCTATLQVMCSLLHLLLCRGMSSATLAKTQRKMYLC